MSDAPIASVHDKVITITEQLKQMQVELAEIARLHAQLKQKVAYERPMIDALMADGLYKPELFDAESLATYQLEFVKRDY